jgi:hypothetical protein
MGDSDAAQASDAAARPRSASASGAAPTGSGSGAAKQRPKQSMSWRANSFMVIDDKKPVFAKTNPDRRVLVEKTYMITPPEHMFSVEGAAKLYFDVETRPAVKNETPLLLLGTNKKVQRENAYPAEIWKDVIFPAFERFMAGERSEGEKEQEEAKKKDEWEKDAQAQKVDLLEQLVLKLTAKVEEQSFENANNKTAPNSSSGSSAGNNLVAKSLVVDAPVLKKLPKGDEIQGIENWMVFDMYFADCARTGVSAENVRSMLRKANSPFIPDNVFDAPVLSDALFKHITTNESATVRGVLKTAMTTGTLKDHQNTDTFISKVERIFRALERIPGCALPEGLKGWLTKESAALSVELEATLMQDIKDQAKGDDKITMTYQRCISALSNVVPSGNRNPNSASVFAAKFTPSDRASQQQFKCAICKDQGPPHSTDTCFFNAKGPNFRQNLASKWREDNGKGKCKSNDGGGKPKNGKKPQRGR